MWGLIETEAKKRKDEARAWLAERMGPNLLAVSAVANGQTVGRASYVEGKTALKVVDPDKFTAFVLAHYPTEIATTVTVNPAFQKTLLDEAVVVDGTVVDKNGLPVDGVEQRVSTSYVSVSKAKDAREKVADLLAGGVVTLDGLAALEPADDCGLGVLPEPLDRYTTDRQAGGVQ